MFRTMELRLGWVPSILRGRGVIDVCILVIHPHRFSNGKKPVSLAQYAVLTIHRHLYMTEPLQGFTYVHPSSLPLAQVFPMVGNSFGLYPWLRTPSLPMTHAQIGDRLGH